jgi:hypothetical protein
MRSAKRRLAATGRFVQMEPPAIGAEEPDGSLRSPQRIIGAAEATDVVAGFLTPACRHEVPSSEASHDYKGQESEPVERVSGHWFSLDARPSSAGGAIPGLSIHRLTGLCAGGPT